MWDGTPLRIRLVSSSLRKQLGAFLKKERAEMSYSVFGRKVGISKSTLQRLEMGEQNVTLDTLEHILKKLKKRLTEVFPE